MKDRNNSVKLSVVASQHAEERDYWLKKLSGELIKSFFPYDKYRITNEFTRKEIKFDFPANIRESVMKVSSGSEPKIQMLLLAGLVVLLYKYTANEDIIVATPIYKQKVNAAFVNTVLPIRVKTNNTITFKELLLQVRKALVEAVEHQNYPIEELLDKLETETTPDHHDHPLFDAALLLKNIQEKDYLKNENNNITYLFSKDENGLEGVIEYNAELYEENTIRRIINHYTQVLEKALKDVNTLVKDIDILTTEEKAQLLVDFNDTTVKYPIDKPIHRYFEERAEKSPDNEAILGPDESISLTYAELNRKANQLAHHLNKKGVNTESVVGIMMERTPQMITGLLATLKAGAAYLPMDTGMPDDRIQYMLDNAKSEVLLTDSRALTDHSFYELKNVEKESNTSVVVTPPRTHIKGFNELPMPDRSLLNLKNYKNKIGMASVTNCISIQSTRGCPYECLYCHKIWSKHHVYRNAENIYNEIEYYYKNGVTNFAFIDDCFNLNRDVSSGLFRLIVKNKLNVQIFFPNGLRGDIMTPDYIDLMVEAGTRGINLSLETAAPRLQKLLKKYLNLDKFRDVMDYISTQHSNVILEMASMHGFPGETEEEAMMTLNFIKSIKWIHFPYIHILKIFPNTEMEEFALQNGVSKEDIMISKDRAFHELPETLPFPKSFTRKYQASFMNEYFLDKGRLSHVLPVQMKVLNREALVQKYNAYLPVEIKKVQDIIDFAGLDNLEVPPEYREDEKIQQESAGTYPTIYDRPITYNKIVAETKKILLLDLSQHFSSHSMLYSVAEQPLGLVYLLTHLKEKFGEKVDGRIYKSGNDFDSYEELETLVKEYQPDLIGIRALTFFKEFFHETVSQLRDWGITSPIITGGPYASSDYDTILKDKHVDLVVMGEGEYTVSELLEHMFNDNFKLPGNEILKTIKGIAFAAEESTDNDTPNRSVVVYDRIERMLDQQDTVNPGKPVMGKNLAYVMYTSGSTGKPKGVMIEHRQVNNCIHWMQDKFNIQEENAIVQRTNLTFDPSVWEIFWPFYVGAKIKLLNTYQSKDADYLLKLMESDRLTMMYCPASMLKAMTYVLEHSKEKKALKMPWLLIGAESVTVDVVKTFYRYYSGKIVNTYGPTEGTINNTYYDLDPEKLKQVVPIGKPVANNKIYILSKDSSLQPVNVAGEICIAGDSLARGYINDEAKTTESFITSPFSDQRIYKTGDIGRWLEDGTIEIMGRVDEQVKIRGYRIELGEIENAITAYPAVNESVVIVRDGKDFAQSVKACKSCGITTQYPGIQVNEERICNACLNYKEHKKFLEEYFKTLEDLELVIREKNKNSDSPYDCLLVYSGGRGAAYALYQLVDMGLRVLTVTYDNGYFSKADRENIEMITKSLNVPNIIIDHKNSNQILKESLNIAQTVCRGCFHTSASIGAQYAYNNNIPVVVGATLSRGQIIENKLMMFLNQGITETGQLEKEILHFQKMAPKIDKQIFGYIDIEEVSSGAIHDKVAFFDFYRYSDIKNEEMIEYLDSRDSYWNKKKKFAVYSTNCPIKLVGDYAHKRSKEFHYYGSATSWEKRLGHITLENVKEDLNCNISERGYKNFLEKIDYREKSGHERDLKNNDKFLCAYITPANPGIEKSALAEELKNHLARMLPDYMLPAHIQCLDTIPLTENGKVDKKALPVPQTARSQSKTTYVAPKSGMENQIAEIWKDVLGIEQPGTEDNFFELGGNSMDIILMGNKLKDVVNQEISVVTLFTYPTIKALAEHFNSQTEDKTETKIEEQIPSEIMNDGKDMMKRSMQKLGGLL